ncbi:MAG TPA: phosphatidate cytidylyltransferase [Bauldia sp.]|nr:phosphatidate cytidylyltransferase [Bauldia sp.]
MASPVGNEILVRIVSAVALAVIALVGALLGGWATAIVLAVVTAIFHLEWVRLTDGVPFPGAVFTISLVLAIAMTAMGLVIGGLILVALAVGFSALMLSPWRPAGVIYAAMLGLGLLILRLTPMGLPAVIFVLAIVWTTDTAAFFAGRAIGGAKLAPRVSPNKTWAGAIGGLVGGVVAGLIVAAIAGLPLSPLLILIAALLSAASQGGDLFESWVKRVFGAKDSGTIIPGHGGLMDRVDGLAVAGGVAAIVGWLHAGANVSVGLLLW